MKHIFLVFACILSCLTGSGKSVFVPLTDAEKEMLAEYKQFVEQPKMGRRRSPEPAIFDCISSLVSSSTDPVAFRKAFNLMSHLRDGDKIRYQTICIGFAVKAIEEIDWSSDDWERRGPFSGCITVLGSMDTKKARTFLKTLCFSPDHWKTVGIRVAPPVDRKRFDAYVSSIRGAAFGALFPDKNINIRLVNEIAREVKKEPGNPSKEEMVVYLDLVRKIYKGEADYPDVHH